MPQFWLQVPGLLHVVTVNFADAEQLSLGNAQSCPGEEVKGESDGATSSVGKASWSLARVSLGPWQAWGLDVLRSALLSSSTQMEGRGCISR